ncbi:uncharacterized protein MYCFIDRAFT_198674 [Pseudocercospora fijiensis CIRAD86]|uniref:Ubiquitin-like protease family profile domain-containing protein n=1 Tax=Pseudocercospora fijiensis (strain CIRAD86) TaxID=383855 RepID=M3A745_PSEFD|nr:uncharacterized protein MYCFIDRAFT_198674 [Pseudocercospora fijiensis CIRAD86]EME80446.1 hypothetical protein MYCFIDRAFT_198674 [Pseudocercospora fijiensis CIRAD86]
MNVRTRSRYVAGDDDLSPVVATQDPEKILAHKEQEVEEVDTKESIRDRAAAKAEEKAAKAEKKDAENQASSSKGGKKATRKKAPAKKAAAPKAAGVKKSSTKKGAKGRAKNGKGKAKATALAAGDPEEPAGPAADTAESAGVPAAIAQDAAEPGSGSTSAVRPPAQDGAGTSLIEGDAGHAGNQAVAAAPETEVSGLQGTSAQTEQKHEDTPAITPTPARIASASPPAQREPVAAAPITPLPRVDSNQAREALGDIPHTIPHQNSFTGENAAAAHTTAANSEAPSGELPLSNATEVEPSRSISSAQEKQTMANDANTLSSGASPSGQPAFGYSATVFPGAYTQSRRRSRKSSKDDGDDAPKRKKSGGDGNDTGSSGQMPSGSVDDPCKDYPSRLQELVRRRTNFKTTAEDPVVEGQFLLDETLQQAIVSVAEAVTEKNEAVRFAYLPPAGIVALSFPGMPKPGQQTARPGRPVLFPFSTMDNASGRGHHSLFVLDRGENQDFEIYHYDSAKRTGHTQDFQEHVTKFKDLLRDLGWARHTNFSIPETAHPRTNQIRQNSAWECGLHTVFNAWAIALGLEIASGPATVLRNYKNFQRDGVQMINLTRESKMDSKTIEAFLKCYGFVAPTASVPADRAFEKTIPILRNHDLNVFIDRLRLDNDLDEWRVNDASIPNRAKLEEALRDSGRSPSEVEFDIQDSSETLLARYRAIVYSRTQDTQERSAPGPASTSDNQPQNGGFTNKDDGDNYEPEPLDGSDANIQGANPQLPPTVGPQAEDQDVSAMADGRSQIAEFINRHGTPEQRQRQREATHQDQTRRFGGSASMVGGSSAADISNVPSLSHPPNTAVVGADLSSPVPNTHLNSDPLTSIQMHLAQDAHSREAAAAATTTPTTPPNTSALVDVMSGNRIPTPEPRSAREAEAVTTILESVAQPDPLDREERAAGPPALDPNPLTEPEDPGLRTDDDLFGEDGDDDEEITITTSPVAATAPAARSPTGLALPPTTPRGSPQTFLPGLRPPQGSSGQRTGEAPPASPPRGTVRPREDDENEPGAEKPNKLARFLKETETHEEPHDELDDILRGGYDDDEEDNEQGNNEYAEMLRRQGVNVAEEDGDGEEDIYGD